jgi:hypothetical protein
MRLRVTASSDIRFANLISDEAVTNGSHQWDRIVASAAYSRQGIVVYSSTNIKYLAHLAPFRKIEFCHDPDALSAVSG